jgi:translation initiation factor 4E
MQEGLLEEQNCKLNYTFIFWFSYFKENKQKQINDYEENLRKIGSFNTAEEFWGYYQHIRRPDSLPKGCEFLLFKEGIKPLWEDTANLGGGRFVLHIKKIFSNKTWEDILLAFIITDENFDKINGVVINVRGWEVLLSVWTKELSTEDELEKYKKWLRVSLGMTENIKIDYKQFPNPEELLKRAAEEKCEAKNPTPEPKE